jgi:hypothetical protein
MMSKIDVVCESMRNHTKTNVGDDVKGNDVVRAAQSERFSSARYDCLRTLKLYYLLLEYSSYSSSWLIEYPSY